MKDQPSTSDKDDDEPERPEWIPDYFLWYPDMRAWDAPPQPPESGWDAEAWRREFNEELKNLSEEERRKGTFSADELRAAGAFDVPASWRKSLGKEPSRQRELFADDWPDATEQETEQDGVELDTDDEGAADEDD